LKEDLASGRISSDSKVRAARFAITTHGVTTILSPLSLDESRIDQIVNHFRKHWKFWINAALYVIGLVIAFFALK